MSSHRNVRSFSSAARFLLTTVKRVLRPLLGGERFFARIFPTLGKKWNYEICIKIRRRSVTIHGILQNYKKNRKVGFHIIGNKQNWKNLQDKKIARTTCGKYGGGGNSPTRMTLIRSNVMISEGSLDQILSKTPCT